METEQIEEPTTDVANNPTSLIALAIAKNSPIETIERLMDLQERWQANIAKQKFAKSFVEMKPKLPLVARTKINKQTSSSYAALEDINRQIDSILNSNGFATATKIIAQTDTSVTIEAELWHEAGHIERTSVIIPLDDRGMQGTVNKTKPHATSSSITYGKRIAICALLNISTGDDQDGNKAPTGKGESKKILDAKKKQITDFKTATEINLNYKQIEADAQQEGISKEDLKTLHEFVNVTYKKKKNDNSKK